MIRQSFHRRFSAPAVKPVVFFAVSYTAYFYSWKITSPGLHQAAGYVFGLAAFACLAFGAMYVYGQAYARGAGPFERIAAVYVLPLAWAAKEVFVLSGVYSLGESLYFFVNPVCVLAYSAVLAEIGFSELRGRARMRRRGELIRGPVWPSVLAMIVGLTSVVLMFALDFGVHHFYLFQEGYKALFGLSLGL